ncbi:polyphosphoinositide phosphatase [Lutzomyia longipalpis]|uniref:Putative phosphoinositide phosphatase sac1 n=1 Tax=Lutzomyia longipalpis TaxID=7200 RepID=A0A1B0CKJ8_LUTLO|nr:polyphosphoinositide phosphatase [Lutzomyia longipalpis]
MNTSKAVTFNPIISSIQKVALYETKTKLFLIGSNNQETRFRILEIDRTSTNELKIYENPNELESRDIRKLINSIGYTKFISAYGVLGFVKFLEGYYLILVTKRTRCAVIGMHLIYTIKDTVMIKVNESSTKQPHPYEQRYIKMFSNIDMRSNFYFCYSYDLTRSLQYNLSGPKFVGPEIDINVDEPLSDWKNMKPTELDTGVEFAFRSISRKRFVWNNFLLRPMQHILHRDWLLEIIHGFISQSNINIFGRSVYVCLIARRSTRFAGTRFLKRGANHKGDVANEVETEQIVMDGKKMCSFVQMRGSIPSHWSQDISKMVPKPPISLDLGDPYAETSAKHIERLLFHYGAPVIILNLVKKREKRKHESILTEEMLASVKYLNQFLPSPHRIKYIHFDMARKSRGDGNVMNSLAAIAENVIQQTGMFLYDGDESQMYQTGIVRVNCVDCLDRTNTAQFAIGKCGLGHQLCKLGFLDPPKLEFDSDCVTMLETLYEDHGDTLALQYGGSQLVHRIKTYRKTAAWTSQGNDIMQTLSRYYSNTFSDTEKQHSINLFLGYYVPHENDSKQNSAIWELPSDYYMHNLQRRKYQNNSHQETPLTEWVRPIVMRNLPYSTSDNNKIVAELIRVHSKHVEMIDSYSNYHLPHKLTAFEEHIAYQISYLARNFVRTFRTNFSPFEPGKHDRSTSSKNPSLTGQSSTSSTTSSTSSSMEEDSTSDEELVTDIKAPSFSGKREPIIAHSLKKTLLPSTFEVYGIEIRKPDKKNFGLYKKYVQMSKQSISPDNLQIRSSQLAEEKKTQQIINLTPLTIFRKDSYESVEPPIVPLKSTEIYQKYVDSPNVLFNMDITSHKVCDMITNYVKFIK